MRLLTLLLLFTSNSFSQTTVIAKKTKNAIYVGADSKVRSHRYYPDTKETFQANDTMCKIWTNGKVGFAVMGMHITEAKSIAATICNNNDSLKEIIFKYVDSFGTYFIKDLIRLRSASPKSFSEIMKEQYPTLCRILFFGIESDTLAMYSIEFNLKDSSLLAPIEIQPKGSGTITFAGGKIKEIEHLLKNPKSWKKEHKIPKAIESMIKIECQAQPETVAEPIDILLFSKKGVKWIKKQKRCKS